MIYKLSLFLLLTGSLFATQFNETVALNKLFQTKQVKEYSKLVNKQKNVKLKFVVEESKKDYISFACGEDSKEKFTITRRYKVTKEYKVYEFDSGACEWKKLTK